MRRRIKAIASFASAAFILVLPFLLTQLLKQIAALSSAQTQSSFNLPPAVYAFCVIVALGSTANGFYLWKRANHADQGAKGEEDIAEAMLPLQQAGWQIEYGMRLGNRLGDADIVCISPQGKAFVIDVKSHRGTVTTDGKQLSRQMGKQTYPFEKDFLSQAMKQALQVKKQKNLDFVTPIVAFSNAKVSIRSNKVQKVYVVEKLELIPLLKTLTK
ncbi:nuclease-related domain-containing protein [Leptolyngbya ohadii]|uniref:nuclease-related domain-containing protein n=1 Tax=Leptolyngbya ohadii TaxID=1962290 RepID=UPI001CED887F|nr:nuclease-related domain-containing protein [Leptolyngbya ohadii]